MGGFSRGVIGQGICRHKPAPCSVSSGDKLHLARNDILLVLRKRNVINIEAQRKYREMGVVPNRKNRDFTRRRNSSTTKTSKARQTILSINKLFYSRSQSNTVLFTVCRRRASTLCRAVFVERTIVSRRVL